MRLTLFIILSLTIFQLCYSDSLTTLTCEYRSNPFGIDAPEPRLGWLFHSSVIGQKQTAYQIMVGSNLANVDAGDVWNSGKITSEQSVHVKYAGPALLSGKCYYWKVRIWDKDGVPSAWSDTAMWCMGKLAASDWKGHWIGSGQKRVSINLRKAVTLSKIIRQATAFWSGLGTSELYINGKKATDDVLSPGYTTFNRRTLYVVHDITHLLSVGENIIGVVLGNGFYCPLGGWMKDYATSSWVDAPKLLLDIELEFTDGTSQTIASDTTWKWSANEITYNDIWRGQVMDMRLSKTGWDSPGYDDSAWTQALRENAPGTVLSARQNPPIRATTISGTSEAAFLSSGWPRLTVNTPGDFTAIIKGKQYYGGADSMKCVFTSDGKNVFEPRFSFGTFDDFTVQGIPSGVNYTLEEVAVHADLRSVGSFSCSNALLNSFQAAAVRSHLNYSYDVPMDPTREYAGWTEDAQNGFETQVYNFDCFTMYRKWLQDMMDNQYADGSIPEVTPGEWESGDGWNSPFWGGMVIWLPWQMYEYYGDKRVLEECYVSMKKYFEYLRTKAGTSNEITWFGLGDWYPVGTDPKNHINTMEYYWHARAMSRTASILGNTADSLSYTALANSIKISFNTNYFDPQTGYYTYKGEHLQSLQAFALYTRIAPDDKREAVRDRLIDLIKFSNMRFTTGFVTTPCLLKVLSDYDRADIIYAIANRDGGWSRCMHNGVFWEDWGGGGVQMPSLGANIGLWFYYGLAGIRPDTSEPGFKKIIINPGLAGGLSYVNGTFRSPYGTIVSNWQINGTTFTLDVTIPPNTSAKVFIPTNDTGSVTVGGVDAGASPGVAKIGYENNKVGYRVVSGTYHFSSQIPTQSPLRMLQFNKSVLTFTADTNGNIPDNPTIGLVNSESGIPSLTVQPEASWLQTTLTGTGSAQIIHHSASMNRNSIPGNSFSTQVRVSADGYVDAYYRVKVNSSLCSNAKASSEHSSSPAWKAIDGDSTTGWHTNYPGFPLPQSITLTLVRPTLIDKFFYLPRQDAASENGIITRYEISTSLNDTDYTILGSGTWPNNRDLKEIQFPATMTRYVRLTALQGVNGFASAMEVYPGQANGTGLSGSGDTVEVAFSSDAAPNPFNPSVNIHYELPPNMVGKYAIYNFVGQLLFSADLESGSQGKHGMLVWNGRDRQGNSLGSGVYFGRLVIQNGQSLTAKLIMLK